MFAILPILRVFLLCSVVLYLQIGALAASSGDEAPLPATDTAQSYLRIASFHFPPFVYNPYVSTTGQPGLVHELYSKAIEKIGYEVKFVFYPPSRRIKSIRDGDIDLFSTEISASVKYLDHYYCNNKPVFYLPVVLYQNTSMHRPQYSHPENTLIPVRIIAPKESKVIFSRMLHPSNQLVKIALPRNLTRMFVAQREAFMIDYKARAEPQLMLLKPTFTVHTYPLRDVSIVLCARKSFQRKIDTLVRIIRSYKDSNYLTGLEAKYQVRLQWQPSMERNAVVN